MTAEVHAIYPPEPDLDAAVEFLKTVNPDGRQTLQALWDGGGTEVVRFEPGHWDEKRKTMERWAQACRNIYVMVNEQKAGATSMHEDTVAFIRAVCSDTDHKRVQAAAIAAVDDPFKQSHAAYVNDSGGGIHTWSLLGEKVAVDAGTKSLAERAGQGLQAAFGGDSVWNINRIMRVPGTVNWLTAKKKAEGRQIAPTFVLAASDARTTLEQIIADYPAAVVAKAVVTDKAFERALSEVGGSVGAPEAVELKKRFEQSRIFSGLWTRGVVRGDASGSGHVFQLALAMRGEGFTGSEFAHIAAGWDKLGPKNLEQRSLARAWASAAPSAQAGRAFTDGVDTEAAAGPPPKPRPKLAPAVGADPAKFPRRQWLYGRRLIRSYMSSTVAAGGIGKTALTMVEAVAMTTGRDLLNIGEDDMPREPLRVLMWNGEDPAEELMRRFLGIRKHYGVTDADVGERLFLASGMDYPIRFGAETDKADAKWIDELIGDERIDVVMVDPFVSSHGVSENDNMAIDRVAKTWSTIAKRHACSVDLVHHIRKPANGGVGDLSVDDARGASALINASRHARVLSPMTPEDAKRWGISNHKAYFGIQHAATKANMAPGMTGASWYRHVSVDLGNGDIFEDGEGSKTLPGDSVGVVEAWEPSTAINDNPVQINAALDELGKQDYRQSAAALSGIWAGVPIASALGLDVLKDAGFLKEIIKKWIKDGWIKVALKNDHRRKPVPCIEVVNRPKIEF